MSRLGLRTRVGKEWNGCGSLTSCPLLGPWLESRSPLPRSDYCGRGTCSRLHYISRLIGLLQNIRTHYRYTLPPHLPSDGISHVQGLCAVRALHIASDFNLHTATEARNFGLNK
jgi:hypothetical protein